MKAWLRRGACGIVFLALLAAMVLRLDSALKLVQEDNLCPRYYAYPDETFDVAFLGASLVMYSIYPMELYGEYGMAAYNLSTGNQSMEASYYLAKEAIEKDHPSLLVLDCSLAWDDDETMEPQYIHYITDTMPYLNRNRIDLIRNLSAEGEDKKPLLFPLIAFHSRWQELTFEDALPQSKELVYGAKVTGRVEASQPFQEAEISPRALSETSRKYILQTIDLCRETGTDLLLLSVPVIGKNKFFNQKGFNLRASLAAEVRQLAAENGIAHANYFGQVEELGLDLRTDAYDGEHMNRWGAVKFTKILGQYIKDHYDIPDRRGQGGAYGQIEEDWAQYPVNRMRDSLRRSLFLRDYAATLRGDACQDPVEDAVVLIALNGKVDEDILTEDDAALLQGMGLSQDLHAWEGHGYVAVIDGGRVVYESLPKGPGQGIRGVGAEEGAGPDGREGAEAGQTDAPGDGSASRQGKSGQFEDFADAWSGSLGQVSCQVTSGRVDEETGAVHSAADIVVDGLSYATGDRGLHFAVFQKSTGALLDQCWLDIHSRALSCTHDNH